MASIPKKRPIGDATPEGEIQDEPRILTLDGGGIRGLSSLYMLDDIMQELRRASGLPEPPRPCQYFDLIGGTSTGGLIAIMLGRLGMTVEECINAYLALSKKVFDVDQVLGGVIPTGDDQCRFSHLTLERSIKDLIKERLGSEDIKLSAMTDQPGCRTFVVTKMAMYLNAPTELFRSYELEGFNSIDPAMWEAARATSAAPTFFRPINITPPGIDWVDGGLGSNNPSQIARDEAERIWPKSKSCCLVSLGTGHPSAVTLDVQNLETDVEAQRNVFQQIKDFVPKILSTIPGWKTVQNFPPGVLAVLKMASVLSSLITDSEAVDERLSHASERNQFPYFRFNVERQVGDIGLEDHTKSRQIAALSRGYLNQHTTRRKKMDCVKRLVAYHTFTHEQEENSIDQKVAGLVLQITSTPSDHHLQLRLADALSGLDSGRAIAEWSSLIKKHPEEWRLQSQLANIFVKMEDSDPEQVGIGEHPSLSRLNTEIMTWKRLVSESPKVWALQVQLAKAFSKKGDIDDEIAGWFELVSEYPQDWKLQNELAQAFTKKNKNAYPAEAIDNLNHEILCWKKLVDQHSDNWELQLRLADAHSKTATFEETALIFSRILGIRRGENAIVHRLRLVMRKRLRLNRAIEDWHLLVANHPGSRGIQMQLEMAYMRKRSHESAIDDWKHLVDRHPTYIELAIHLKRAYDRQDDLAKESRKAKLREREIAGWMELVKKHPKEPTLQTYLAEAYSRNRDVVVEMAGWKSLLNNHPLEQDLRDRLLNACLKCETLEMAKAGLQGVDRRIPRNRELESILEQMFRPI